jgi:3-methyladenine DNA glycosylase/8-oxoguanine DNA glycosylase
LKEALTHLKKADPVLAPLLERHAYAYEPVPDFEPFQALARAIAHQQLHGKAAETILGRFIEKVGKGEFPSALQVKRARMTTLRACGFSTAKSLALKDLAAKRLDGTIPDAAELHAMKDDEVVERLTSVRGVGRWTVEMMLMNRMGRLDVLPADDFGVRKGFTVLYRKRGMVTRKALLKHGERWRPYRSVASWYMWRVLSK